ncbi:MAG: lysine--tRNA ligase [Candidatus Burarchaeum sp.]|nr:lysine--tRNA ligase [Candidatus Burarchaeum sp.]MDO8340291.1 lysine--tRNA ligase [Candidatus Burarchaeum sp.]
MDENAHWIERIAEKVAAEKKPPYVVNSGMTPSGPVHLGTLCEFLYPAAITEFLSRNSKASFSFIADDMDAFDRVPASAAEHAKELEPHLGKPLCRVPDPMGCCKSLGEHFLKDAEGAMEKFEARPKILRASELYAEGKYDKYALLFFERLEEVKRAVYESSLRNELPGWWSPVMPVCRKCGRISTTRVISFDFEDGGVCEYACDRDLKYVKGCGFVGEARIKEHEYKITWRLDWPARQDFLDVSVEGGGMDHFTRGGSRDTAVAIHEKIFGKSPPVGYRFGFVLLKGKKYSKSKGEGMGVADLGELIPPEVLKYALLRPDVQENKDIDTSGEAMLRLCEEYLAASRIKLDGGTGAEGSSAGSHQGERGTDTASAEGGPSGAQPAGSGLSRADRKKAVAFGLSTKKQKFSMFSEILLFYQLYRDWKKVAELSDKKSAEYLKPYIENWVRLQFLPEEYAFEYAPRELRGNAELVHAFAERLEPKMTALDVHNLVFEVARGRGEKPEELFKDIYETLINKPKGPKLGKLIEALGIAKVKSTLLELHKKK